MPNITVRQPTEVQAGNPQIKWANQDLANVAEKIVQDLQTYRKNRYYGEFKPFGPIRLRLSPRAKAVIKSLSAISGISRRRIRQRLASEVEQSLNNPDDNTVTVTCSRRTIRASGL